MTLTQANLNPDWNKKCRFGLFDKDGALRFASDSLEFINNRLKEFPELILIIHL